MPLAPASGFSLDVKAGTFERMAECEFLFIYGSLKQGHAHHGQMTGAKWMGRAQAKCHHLVQYEESYPALVACTEGCGRSPHSVEGELYLVDEEQLRRLDLFEESPQLYQRAKVELSDGRRAWAYVIEKSAGESYPFLGERYG